MDYNDLTNMFTRPVEATPVPAMAIPILTDQDFADFIKTMSPAQKQQFLTQLGNVNSQQKALLSNHANAVQQSLTNEYNKQRTILVIIGIAVGALAVFLYNR